MKICPKCNKNHECNGTFCSRSCANSRGPRPESVKSLVRQKLTGRPSSLKGKKILPRIISNCYICKSEIEVIERDKDKNITCKSSSCIAHSNRLVASLGGTKSALTQHKRSKDEIRLYELIRSVNQSAQANVSVEDGWDADIVIFDRKHAILWNGPWHYKEMGLSNHSLKQVQNRDKLKMELFEVRGWKVFVYEDRHWTPEQAFQDWLTSCNE